MAILVGHVHYSFIIAILAFVVLWILWPQPADISLHLFEIPATVYVGVLIMSVVSVGFVFLPGHLHYRVETPKKPCFLFAALSTLLLMSAASASYSFFFEAKCAHQLAKKPREDEHVVFIIKVSNPILSFWQLDQAAWAPSTIPSSVVKLRQSKDHISTRLQEKKGLLRKLQFKVSCDLKLKIWCSASFLKCLNKYKAVSGAQVMMAIILASPALLS
ncbi:hypothetical protein OPV22_022303 [Ensete ventricosum]|uniref:Magnesium transporter n=1 Tax=Ensete ventricosum TaxID=4639 RepID=A0AAV8PDY7_ENSVE|nr:hypothetical protein OPV22_022303 [Ensete ventricosum]